MSDSETIAKYLNRLQLLVNSMKACEKIVTNQNMVEKILRTMSPRFDYIVVAIKESKDVEKMIVEGLQGSLEAHELKLLTQNAEKVNEEQALQVQVTKKVGSS